MKREVELIINPEPITMINFTVTKEFKHRLKLRALQNNESVSNVARRLLEGYLKEPSPKKRKRIIKKNA